MKRFLRRITPALIALLMATGASAQKFVRVNQIGYMTNAPKQAQVAGMNAHHFELKNAKTEETVFKGSIPEGKRWNQSREMTQYADFSDFKTPGTYFVEVTGERS